MKKERKTAMRESTDVVETNRKFRAIHNLTSRKDKRSIEEVKVGSLFSLVQNFKADGKY